MEVIVQVTAEVTPEVIRLVTENHSRQKLQNISELKNAYDFRKANLLSATNA